MDDAQKHVTLREFRETTTHLLDTLSSNASAPDDSTLEAVYRRILQDRYHLSPAAIERSEIDLSPFPTFENLQAVEEYVFQHRVFDTSAGLFANPYWRRVLAILLESIPPTIPIHTVSFFVGEVPDRFFNASTIPSSDGQSQLILANKGFMFFAFRFVRLLVAAIRFHVRGGRVIEREMAVATARTQALADLNAVFEGRHTTEPFHFTSAGHTAYSTHLVLGLEFFVLAHELGHTMNGFMPPDVSQCRRRLQARQPYFLRRPRVPPRPRTGRYMQRYQERESRFTEEFRADSFGHLFYHAFTEKLLANAQSPEDREQAAGYYAAAPHILFRIIEAFEDAARNRHLAVWVTHPPAVERQRRLSMLQMMRGMSKTVAASVTQTLAAADYLLAPDGDDRFTRER